MTRSESINELATALAKAQSEIQGAKKDTANPFFKSKYADLASIWDAWQAVGPKNGLAVTQSPYLGPSVEPGTTVGVRTLLMHASGQWIEGDLILPVSKPDAQGCGSAITYARRYALAAMVGVAPEDDDGNAGASQRDQINAEIDRKLKPRTPNQERGKAVLEANGQKPPTGDANDRLRQYNLRAAKSLQILALRKAVDVDVLAAGTLGELKRSELRAEIVKDGYELKMDEAQWAKWCAALQLMVDRTTPPADANLPDELRV